MSEAIAEATSLIERIDAATAPREGRCGMKGSVEFRDLPQSGTEKRGARWVAIVEQLKAKPMEWGYVGEFSNSIPSFIRKGMYRAFIDPDSPGTPLVQMGRHWEVASRRAAKPNRVDVFIRYLGD